MKKILIVLVVIANFFIFQSALEKYDDLIESKILTFSPLEQKYDFLISGDISTIDSNIFQHDFEILLDKYELNCYQHVYNREDKEQIVWAYTNDSNHYLDTIILTKGKLSAVNKGDYYFSNDGNMQGTIFNPIKDENYKLYHLNDFSNKNKSIFVPYELYTSKSDREMIYEEFVNDFKSLYPTISVSTLSGESHFEEIDAINYNDIIFTVLTSLMVILGINIIIIKQTKKIQILKLDGYSNWQIYKK